MQTHDVKLPAGNISLVIFTDSGFYVATKIQEKKKKMDVYCFVTGEADNSPPKTDTTQLTLGEKWFLPVG